MNPSLSSTVKLNRLFLASLSFALLALVMSFWAEFIWTLNPCSLCQWQRTGFLIIMLISISGLYLSKKAMPTLLLSLAYVGLFLIAGYHAMIQLGIFSDPCVVASNIQTLDDYRALLAAPPSCATIPFRLFGLPVTAITSMVSFTFVITLSLQATLYQTESE